MAPRAKLLLVSTETDFGDGLQDFRDITDAVDWTARHRDVTALSMSYGVFESALADAAGKPGDYRLVHELRRGLQTAASRGTTLIAAAGNHGPTGPKYSGDGTYAHRTVPWPASDPLVTGVGATDVTLDDTGNRTAPDRLWTDDADQGGASGSGTSRVWPGLPSADIAAVGGGSSRTWIYSSYHGLPGQNPGWSRAAGTSAAAPTIAGITTLAAQQAGHKLGNITPAIRSIPAGTNGTADLIGGCNTAWKVTGYCATPGADTASGIGTINNAALWTQAIARRHR